MDYYDFCELHRAEISALLRERCEALREPITRYVADELAVLTAGEPDTRTKPLKAYCCEPHPNWYFPRRRDFFAHNDLLDSGINQIVERHALDALDSFIKESAEAVEPYELPDLIETLSELFHDDYADFGYCLADELLPDEFEDCEITVGDFIARNGSGIVYDDEDEIPLP